VVLLFFFSDASEMHLKTAEYIEKQFAANLSRFYTSLSYHYSNAEGEEANAFKYTVKAADAIIGKGAFKVGLDLLLTAQEMCTTAEEFSVVLRICNRGIKEIKRASTKGSRKGKDKQSPGFPVGLNLSSFNKNNSNNLGKEKESPLIKHTSGRMMSFFSSSPLKTIHSPRTDPAEKDTESNKQASSKEGESGPTSFRRSLLSSISATFNALSIASPPGSSRTPTIDPAATPGGLPLMTSPNTHAAEAGSTTSADGHILTQYTNLAEELEGDVEMMMDYDNSEGGGSKIIVGTISTKTAPLNSITGGVSQKAPLEAVHENGEVDDGDGAVKIQTVVNDVKGTAGKPPPSAAVRLSASFERTFSFLGRSDSNSSATNAHNSLIINGNVSAKKTSISSNRVGNYQVIENLSEEDKDKLDLNSNNGSNKNSVSDKYSDQDVELGVSTKHLKVLSKPSKLTFEQRMVRNWKAARRSVGNNVRSSGRLIGSCCGCYSRGTHVSKYQQQPKKRKPSRVLEEAKNKENSVTGKQYIRLACWYPRFETFRARWKTYRNKRRKASSAAVQADASITINRPVPSARPGNRSWSGRSAWRAQKLLFCCMASAAHTVRPISSAASGPMTDTSRAHTVE
jgi:hypothetical protein